MSNNNYLQDIAKEYAIKAVELDRSGKYELATFYYLVSFVYLYVVWKFYYNLGLSNFIRRHHRHWLISNSYRKMTKNWTWII